MLFTRMSNNWYISNIGVLSPCELNLEFLHDLHHGEPMDDIIHIQKMSLPTLNGGLWAISLQYTGYHNIYNAQFTFGTKIVIEL
jgi:hypothetical protein